MLESLQDGDSPFSIQIDKQKNERDSLPITKACSHSSKSYYKVRFIHSLKRERDHSDFLSRYHGLALGSKY